MSETVVPMYLWDAREHHLTALKEAKAKLPHLPLVRPVEALPGQGTRCLSFGGHPPFACDSYLVVSPDVIPAALEWALNGGLDDENVRGYAAFLTEIFGKEVREIDD